MLKLHRVRASVAHPREGQHAFREPQDELVRDDHALAMKCDQDAVDPMDDVGTGAKDGVEGDGCEAQVKGFKIMSCELLGEVGGMVVHGDDGPFVAQEGFVCSREEEGTLDVPALGRFLHYCIAHTWEGVAE